MLREWAQDGFARQLLVLDREGTAPRITGVPYRVIAAHDYAKPDQDRDLLQQICDEESADLFVSSYYTSPIATPSVFVAYDMIPEVFNWDVSNNPVWREKHTGIVHAGAFIAISQNTANDLRRFFPGIRPEQVTVCHCGVDFSAPELERIKAFKARHGIEKPYFLLIGARGGYKNANLFFQSFSSLGEQRGDYAIVCTGPSSALEPAFAPLAGGARVHMLEIDDEEIQCAYTGAIALVYPSIYEGFGMPITEAMACACPVITCPTGSIPEVAGDSVLYVAPNDIAAMTTALRQVQELQVRAALIAKGLQRAVQFSWKKMATEVKTVLLNADLETPMTSQRTLPHTGSPGATAKMKKRSLTVIIPSRSQPRQAQFLERAAASIRAQTAISNFDLAILIGVDKGEAAGLQGGIARSLNLNVIESRGRSQAAALNAVIRCADSEFVAFLEDDDLWHPHYLEFAETALTSGTAFVSSTQVEFDESDTLLRINDFPTPSGWIMPLSTLRKVGEFNEEYRFHLDNEWLGRLSETKLSRVHLVEATAPLDPRQIAQVRPWLFNVIQWGGGFTRLGRHALPYPLIRRLVHSESGMGQISTNASYQEISKKECSQLQSRFGRMPW